MKSSGSNFARKAALLLIAVLAVFSCKKGKAPEGGAQGVIDAIAEGVEAAVSGTAAYVIRPESSFWTIEGDELKWAESLQLGTEVMVTGPSRKANYDKNEYSVLPVKLDSGKDGFVIEQHLGTGESLGVVVTDLATLYKQPKDTAVMSTILPKMNVVVVTKDEANPDYYKFEGINSESYERFTTRYLLASDVSVSSEDVNTALLLNAARGMKGKEQRQKLASTITSKYPSSSFTSTVQEYLVALNPDQIGTESVGASYAVKSAGIVRDIPSAFGYELKRLKKGEEVQVAERTAETYVIGDESANWCKISAPVEGWIWGGAIEPK